LFVKRVTKQPGSNSWKRVHAETLFESGN
jgi:hypothetical protein